MHVGEELKQARLARGLTLQQVAAATRVRSGRLYAIEHNDVVGMPMVYVRGYVREFAREVGLDPDDVTERYIAQFETTTEPPVTAGSLELDSPAVTPHAETASAGGLDDGHDRERTHDSAARRRSAWGPRSAQWAVLVLVGLIGAEIGFMLGWSGARRASPVTGDARSTAASVEAEGGSAPTQPEPDAVPAVASAPSTTTVATDLSGGWTMTNQVQKSGRRAFQGLQLVYELELQQDGANISGTGRKISENGRALRGAARTPITLSGTVDGDRVHFTFREKGRRRESGGSFQFELGDDGALRGTFESDAATSSGESIVRRAMP